MRDSNFSMIDRSSRDLTITAFSVIHVSFDTKKDMTNIKGGCGKGGGG